jgi:hypothetical protein
LANLNKCEFAQQSLAYLGYVIGGGELKIDHVKIETNLKWSVLTNVIEFSFFFGVVQYLRKFIVAFSAIATPCHAIIASGKSFEWGKNQQKYFDELK